MIFHQFLNGDLGCACYLVGDEEAGIAVLVDPPIAIEPLLDEELFVILPVASTLIASDRESLTLKLVAALPLILPSPGHGLRRRIALEFERVNQPLDYALPPPALAVPAGEEELAIVH